MINFDCLVLKIFLLSSTIVKLGRFLSTEKCMRQSKIEKALRVPEVKELVECLSQQTERAGFEPAVQ